jgi:hypothetical protein
VAAARSLATWGSKPTPSSATAITTIDPSRSPHSPHRARVGVLGHVRQGLLHHPERHHLEIAVQALLQHPGDLGLAAGPLGQLGQLLAQGRLQPGAVQQRRPQVEQERAGRGQPLLQVLVDQVQGRLHGGRGLPAQAGHHLVEDGQAACGRPVSDWTASSCRSPARRRRSSSWAVMSWPSRWRRSRSTRSRSVTSTATLTTPATRPSGSSRGR